MVSQTCDIPGNSATAKPANAPIPPFSKLPDPDMFSDRAKEYAKHRPTAPQELIDFVMKFPGRREVLWDVGTGSGQAAVKLAPLFGSVIGSDVNERQLAHAPPAANVRYVRTPAVMTDEQAGELIAAPGSVDLVTVSQALHWFNFDSFHSNVRHLLRRPGGVVAAWTYHLFRVSPAVDALMDSFYARCMLHWEPQRAYIDDHYRSIPFEFVPCPGLESTGPFDFSLELHWSLAEVLGYLSSWSPVAKAAKEGTDMLDGDFMRQLAGAWREDTEGADALKHSSGDTAHDGSDGSASAPAAVAPVSAAAATSGIDQETLSLIRCIHTPFYLRIGTVQ